MTKHVAKTRPSCGIPARADTFGPAMQEGVGTRGVSVPRLAWRRLRRPLFRLALYAGDFASPLAAFSVAYVFCFSAFPSAPSFVEVLGRPSTQLTILLVALCHVVVLRQAGMYQLHSPRLPLDLILRLVLTAMVSSVFYLAVTRALHTDLGNRFMLGYFWFLLTALSMAVRLSARAVVLLVLCFGVGVKRVVIVGSTETARQLLRTFQQHPQLAYQVVALLGRSGDRADSHDLPATTTRTGSASQMLRALLDIHPDVVVVATSARKDDAMLDLIAQCIEHGIEVRLVPEFYEIYTSNRNIDRFGAIPMVHLRSLKVHPLSAGIKRTVDLLFCVPMLLLLALAMLRLWPRARRLGIPLFVRETRVGLEGKRFRLYGLNEALRDASADANVPAWFVLLPETLNVLKGDMSVVGPRASKPERAAHYTSWEKRMLAVRPGLIGFTGANERTPHQDVAEQITWNVGYVDQRSLAFDLNVMLAAVPRYLARRADRLGREE